MLRLPKRLKRVGSGEAAMAGGGPAKATCEAEVACRACNAGRARRHGIGRHNAASEGTRDPRAGAGSSGVDPGEGRGGAWRSVGPTKTLPRVTTEMSLHVLAYDFKRVMQIVGIVPLMEAMRA